MQIPPKSVLAAWPTPNYIDPVTHGNENVVLNIVLYTLLCVFISLRVVTRITIRKVFGTDDILILIALIPTTIFFVLSILADTKYLWTRHQYDIPGDQVTTGLKMVMGAEISFAAASTFTKLSMLTFSRRLMANSNLPFWRLVNVLAMCIVSVQGLVFCLTIIWQCRPISDYWNISVGPQPNCIDQTSHFLAAGIINICTDFAVVLLPIRMVLSLRLPRRDLIMVAMLFALGFLSCFAGIARTYYLYITTTTHDQVWAAYPVWMTSAIELYIGVICASIPATKPFFSTYLPRFFGSITGTRSTTTGNSMPTPNISKHAVAPEDTTEDDLQDLISALEKSYGSSPESKFSRLSRLSQQDANATATKTKTTLNERI